MCDENDFYEGSKDDAHVVHFSDSEEEKALRLDDGFEDGGVE